MILLIKDAYETIHLSVCALDNNLPIFAKNNKDLPHNLDISKQLLREKNVKVNNKSKESAAAKQNRLSNIKIEIVSLEQVTK